MWAPEALVQVAQFITAAVKTSTAPSLANLGLRAGIFCQSSDRTFRVGGSDEAV